MDMDNQIQPNTTSANTITRTFTNSVIPISPTYNVWFLVFISILFVIILVAIFIYINRNHPVVSANIKKLTTMTMTTSTPTTSATSSSSTQSSQLPLVEPSSSSMSMNSSSLSAPTEYTNQSASAAATYVSNGGYSNNSNNDTYSSSQTSSSLDPFNDTSLDTALNNAKIANNCQSIPEADDAYSSNIQSNKSSSKSGWCYIGEERGYRSCLQVGENDECMSGDIFPSNDICINPSLRA